MTKMVGLIGEAGEEERVSSYFAKSNSDDSATKSKTSPEVAPAQRFTTVAVGAPATF